MHALPDVIVPIVQGMSQTQFHKGVTLFELLASIFVASILLAVAIPVFEGLILDARRTTRVNGFVAAIHMAKAKAHEQRADIVICKAPTGQACEASATWSEGWLMFINRDEDQPPTIDIGEKILLRVAAVRHGTITGNRNAFVFRPFALSSTNGTLTFCDKRGADSARAVIVSSTGRPRASKHKAGGGRLDCPEP